ncbi:hypothetical protein BSQ33_10475 [Vibrio gazogenes]|uniref:Uncharacterized protein n=1 Tax=Vibrio gazogenes TaxID=687 RepID=A0A1Z2SFW7_VIBGA|nr:hypothetical protein BSQ33_10475 [Vibrio gazogenes]
MKILRHTTAEIRSLLCRIEARNQESSDNKKEVTEPRLLLFNTGMTLILLGAVDVNCSAQTESVH